LATEVCLVLDEGAEVRLRPEFRITRALEVEFQVVDERGAYTAKVRSLRVWKAPDADFFEGRPGTREVCVEVKQPVQPQGTLGGVCYSSLRWRLSEQAGVKSYTIESNDVLNCEQIVAATSAHPMGPRPASQRDCRYGDVRIMLEVAPP